MGFQTDLALVCSSAANRRENNPPFDFVSRRYATMLSRKPERGEPERRNLHKTFTKMWTLEPTNGVSNRSHRCVQQCRKQKGKKPAFDFLSRRCACWLQTLNLSVKHWIYQSNIEFISQTLNLSGKHWIYLVIRWIYLVRRWIYPCLRIEFIKQKMAKNRLARFARSIKY